MSSYNIYGIYRIDGPYKWYFYVGETERRISDRIDEHRRAVGNVYLKNCRGGHKGEVRNIDTPYGRESNKAIYQFIRRDCGGIDGLGTLWDFEQLPSNGYTEDMYINMFLDQGHILFNMKDGEDIYITKKSKCDYSTCRDVKESKQITAEYLRRKQEEESERLRRRKQEEESEYLRRKQEEESERLRRRKQEEAEELAALVHSCMSLANENDKHLTKSLLNGCTKEELDDFYRELWLINEERIKKERQERVKKFKEIEQEQRKDINSLGKAFAEHNKKETTRKTEIIEVFNFEKVMRTSKTGKTILFLKVVYRQHSHFCEKLIPEWKQEHIKTLLDGDDGNKTFKVYKKKNEKGYWEWIEITPLK